MSLSQYCRLLAAFCRREWMVRYGRSLIGLMFLMANPLLMMGMKWVTHSAGTELRAYHFFFFGLIWWLFLSSLITNASAIVSSHSDLVRKNNFPRSILVVLPLCLAVVDGTLGTLFFVVFDLIFFPNLLSQLIYLLPLFLILVPFALGISALMVSVLFCYTKLRYAIPFLLIAVFVSCQFFQDGRVSEVYLWLNPVSGFMIYEAHYLNFHLDLHCIYPSFPFFSLVVGMVYMVAGLLLFRIVSPRFADF